MFPPLRCVNLVFDEPCLVEDLLRVVRICYALIAPCSVKIVAFLFSSLLLHYFITARGLFALYSAVLQISESTG
jgi:hypothetical protein